MALLKILNLIQDVKLNYFVWVNYNSILDNSHMTLRYNLILFRCSVLRMETVCLTESFTSTDDSELCQNPEEYYLPHRRENLRSYQVHWPIAKQGKSTICLRHSSNFTDVLPRKILVVNFDLVYFLMTFMNSLAVQILLNFFFKKTFSFTFI